MMTTHKDHRYQTGGDPRTLADFIALRAEMNKLSHPARPDINWPYAEQLARSLLEHHGADLQTVAWYTLARARLGGLAGINEGLTLGDREWVCLDCGCVHDRDHNAAVNLENWGVQSLATSHALLAVSSTESLNACGEEGSGLSFDSGETDLDEAGIRHEVVHEECSLF